MITRCFLYNWLCAVYLKRILSKRRVYVGSSYLLDDKHRCLEQHYSLIAACMGTLQVIGKRLTSIFVPKSDYEFSSWLDGLGKFMLLGYLIY